MGKARWILEIVKLSLLDTLVVKYLDMSKKKLK